MSIAVSAAVAGVLSVADVQHADAQSFPAVVPLAGLDGSNGFRMAGEGSGDQSGHSINIAGDINGDGIDDVLIGAPRADANGVASGAAYLVFGHAAGFVSTIQLGSLDGSDGFRMDGVAGSLAGWSASGVGDINGDGFDDLLVGAPGASNYAGAGYVVFGRTSPFPAAFNLSTIDGSDGFRLQGVSSYAQAGRSLAAAGDINGDGIDDLVIGQPFGGAGNAFVLFGRNTSADGSFPAIVDLANLDGSNGFRMDGVDTDAAGFSVSGGGDFNGDGFDDLLIGAFRASSGADRAGRAYIIFGSDSTFPPAIDLSVLDGDNGFRLEGENFLDYAGVSVGFAGDFNGDGKSDLIVGGYGTDFNGSDSGSAYVVFGAASPLPATMELASLDGTDGFRVDGVQAGERAGRAVAMIGDINGDGFDDLAIGAPAALADDNYAGSVYIMFGADRPFAASIDPQDFDGTIGFRADGLQSLDNTGISVAGTGDVNGDGFADFIIGANGADSNGNDGSGASFVVFGGVSGPGLIPAIAVGSDRVEFGDIALGGTGSSTLQVENPGTGTLTVVSLSISGLQAAEFSISLDGCSGSAVDPGLFCSIDLDFSPAAAGVRTATLRVDSNAPTSPNFVRLRGSNDVVFGDGFEGH